MDRLLLIPTAVLGIVIVGIYAFVCHKRGKKFDIGTMVSLLFFSAGLIGSVFIIASTFYPELRAKLAELDLYILIAGLVVLAHSVQGLLKELRPSRSEI